MKFSELVRLLGANGFTLVRQKGSIRYYWARLIRVDYHGSKESKWDASNPVRLNYCGGREWTQGEARKRGAGGSFVGG